MVLFTNKNPPPTCFVVNTTLPLTTILFGLWIWLHHNSYVIVMSLHRFKRMFQLSQILTNSWPEWNLKLIGALRCIYFCLLPHPVLNHIINTFFFFFCQSVQHIINTRLKAVTWCCFSWMTVTVEWCLTDWRPCSVRPCSQHAKPYSRPSTTASTSTLWLWSRSTVYSRSKRRKPRKNEVNTHTWYPHVKLTTPAQTLQSNMCVT